jgi:hypothetical protein
MYQLDTSNGMTQGSAPGRAFTLDPNDQSKISLKILHFPLPVG